MGQGENACHRPTQASNQVRLLVNDLSLEHLIDEADKDGAHLLDDLLQPAEPLALLRFSGLPPPAEDILGLAVALAAGLDDDKRVESIRSEV